MRQLYLAATGQNRGKTTAALGLLDGFVRRGLKTGFMKPVGQRTVIDHGEPADEDAVLMHEVFGLGEPYAAMSPVHIPRGFTKAYIAGEVVEDLGARVRRAQAVFADHDVLLVEGTGHAGVGAVIGLSNAVVAASLGTPAIIVSEGGVGRPIDEIVLNAALFERHGVPVAGAIVNKVDVDAQPGIRDVLEGGLAPYGIPLLGILPRKPILSNPTLEMIVEGLRAEMIEAGPDLERVIDGVAIGAMEPVHMLERVGPGTLVIVPGDREDIILTLTTAHLVGSPGPARRAPTRGRLQVVARDGAEPTLDLPLGHDGAAIGLVLTGGYRPRPAVLNAIHRANLFAALVPADTYSVASEVHDLLVKTHPADREKIELIKQLVAENLDVDRILAVATDAAMRPA
ncbi:MAG TPA: AAA family ATPase [Candidatus Limnocylindrales bacterium]|nr:AAA family ATPase [Candidatus Limnocylindrales bacterium]